MFKQEIIQQLEKEVKELFHEESSGHDIYHLKRTLNIALTLQEKEGGDQLIIAVSTFLHDIHRIIQKETGKFCSPKDSLPKIEEKDPSTIHHFHSKLLKLKNNMHTETAKKMANKRHKFMELFLQEFFDEWNGKK